MSWGGMGMNELSLHCARRLTVFVADIPLIAWRYVLPLPTLAL